MADFCFQCAVDMWFSPPGDLAGLCEEGMIVNVLCEGCGAGVWVDHEGWCVTSDCPEHGDMAPGRSEVYERAYRQWKRRSGPLGAAYRLRDRILGSPWEPGEIHFNGRWAWWYNLYKSIRDGEPMHGYAPTTGSFTLDEINPNNFNKFIGFDPQIFMADENGRMIEVKRLWVEGDRIEEIWDGVPHQGPDGKEPPAAGTGVAGKDDQEPPQTGVVRDQDIGPV